eukprot:RCo003820
MFPAEDPESAPYRRSRTTLVRRIVSLRAIPEGAPAAPKATIRLPTRVVVVALLCVFTVAPAVALWMVSWNVTGIGGVNSVYSMSQTSLEAVTAELNNMMVGAAQSVLMGLFPASETWLLSKAYRLKGLGLLSLSAEEAASSFRATEAALSLPLDLGTLPNFSTVAYELYELLSGYPVGSVSAVRRRITYVSLSAGPSSPPEMYVFISTPSGFLNGSEVWLFNVGPSTGQPSTHISHESMPLETCKVDVTDPEGFAWENDLSFVDLSGVPEVVLTYQVPTTDMLAAHKIVVGTSVYTISGILKGLLKTPKQRLFVFFRTAAGTLIGASHGKTYSHSDIDYSANNPITNPPPLEQFRKFTPVNSTDPTIRAAGWWLIGTFLLWDAIPSLNTVQGLVGEDYWVDAAALSTQVGLKLHVVLLVDWASIMGPVEAAAGSIRAEIWDTNLFLMIVPVLMVSSALAFALLLSRKLTEPLSGLAFGMAMLSMLRLEEKPGGRPLLTSRSRFAEVRMCEQSFLSLERGLRAFVKFVPRDVVRMMLSGEMDSTNDMDRRVVSILFMDVV